MSSPEIPVLRLGLAGFSMEQQAYVSNALSQASSGAMQWQTGKFADADAWWANGSRLHQLADRTLRVAPGISSDRTIHLDLRDVDRPIAFSTPLGPANFKPTYTFDVACLGSMHAVLGKFESWLRPVAAQFRLAAQLIEHESALGSGVYHVTANDKLLAVVDLQGEAGVLPVANPADFDDAIWSHRPASASNIPEHFARTSLAQLMWQYAVRTGRDVLPRRYRRGLLYFRRPPRLPQRLLKDTHLLLLRELATAPASFEDLHQRTSVDPRQLAQAIAALYLVGAITSNPKRAAASRTGPGRADAGDSTPSMPLGRGLPGAHMPDSTGRGNAPPLSDLTAPVPMSPMMSI